MPRREHPNGHPEVWAFLTIITFPIVLIASELLGAGGWWPFLYAILATFSVLVLEAIVRGRLWPFEKGFVNHIGHPETPFRILVFLGATLLILQTVLIVGAATDPRFDAPLLGLIIKKECALRTFYPVSESICRFLTESRPDMNVGVRPTDLSEHAMLAYAAKTWFPDGELVTCAARTMLRRADADGNGMRELDLVHCSDWMIDADNTLRAKKSRTGYAAAKLFKQQTGFYFVASWSEDAQSETWMTTLGDIATVCRERVESLGILPDLVTVLQKETLSKAQMMLKQ
jgi:hypothetical protein